ncbi:MAG TPA: helix-turn-helix domain-containing protein [Solirubrobacterales bacterium]|nr:helix-turn-helix domain-containing protein [Solirubrobacterales bacterium]
MGRPRMHPTETMLDAARDLLLERGVSAATIEAVAESSGAPVGSIYHRFGSRDGLVARLWLRAVYRSQASFVSALEAEDPREAAMAAAMSIIEFCEGHPADAKLLVLFRREDLIRTVSDDALLEELEGLNRPVARAVGALARRLYGTRSRAALERTLLVVFDLPYGAARRHLISGTALPDGLRDDLRQALSAVIERPL